MKAIGIWKINMVLLGQCILFIPKIASLRVKL